MTPDASKERCFNLDVGWDHCECLEKLSVTCRSPQQTSKGLSKLSVSADFFNTRIMFSMRKLCYGFYYSLHTLLVPLLHLSLMFASVASTADSLSLEKCCSSSEENKVETQLGPRSCRDSMNCFVIEWVSDLLAKEAGEACRAISLADGPDLTQLLLLCKLGAFSPMVNIYCLKLLWSGSQDVAIKIVILRDKLRHKRKKLKWISQWWRLSSSWPRYKFSISTSVCCGKSYSLPLLNLFKWRRNWKNSFYSLARNKASPSMLWQ